jgi:hypothetical protein
MTIRHYVITLLRYYVITLLRYYVITLLRYYVIKNKILFINLLKNYLIHGQTCGVHERKEHDLIVRIAPL